MSLSCFLTQSLIVAEDGHVFACGDNSRGQLGLFDTQPRPAPLPIVSLRGHKIVQVACGKLSSCALSSFDLLYCASLKQLHSHWNFLVFSDTGRLFTFGDGEHGQLGHGRAISLLEVPRAVRFLDDRPVLCVSCGAAHTLAVLANGFVFFECFL